MKRLLQFLFMVIAWSTQGQKTSGIIAGKVSDATGKPLAYASILLEELKLGVLTDDNGKYSIRKVPQGKHKVLVSFLGYGTRSMNIEVNKDSLYITLDFTLEEAQENLDEVTVNGKTKETENFHRRNSYLYLW